MRFASAALACAALLSAAASSPGAPFGGTVVWEIDAEGFLGGSFEGLETSADGRLTAGREGRAAPLGEGAVNALAAGRNGRVWVLTDSPPQLFELSGEGATRVLTGRKGETFTCLAPDGAGGVWVGASGPGVVYRVAPNNAPMPVEVPGEEVGAIAVDGGGTAWVATGPKGLLVRVSGDGTADRGEAIAGGAPTRLQFDGAGGLVALGHRNGRVARRGPDGRWSVLHDFDEPVTELARHADGWIVAGGATVWRLGEDGAAERLDTGGGTVRALAPGGAGAVLVARRGRVWSLADGRRAVVAELGAGTVTAVLGGDRLRALGSATPAVAVHFGSGRRSGHWTSPVRDCGAAAIAGTVAVDGTPGCGAEIRWGNVRVPDGSWSAWSAVGVDGVVGDGTQRVRYVQIRLRVPAEGRCRGATVSWLPPNHAPQVHAAWRTLYAAKAPGGRTRHFTVEAADRDDDTLALVVRWRHLESGWARVEAPRLLRTDPPALGRHHTPVPDGLPDGRYRLEAVVTDAPSNTAARARSAEHHSEPFVVDTTKPAITAPRVTSTSGVTTAQFTVQDATSRLVRVEWSVDGGPWHVAAATDGQLDARSEQFAAAVGTLATGAHHLLVRATDARGNTGVVVTAFEVK